MTNGDFVNGIISDKNLMKNDRGNGFLQNLTIKINLTLSNTNICCHLKFRIPLWHRQFFQNIISKS